jgi:hypothetical protein
MAKDRGLLQNLHSLEVTRVTDNTVVVYSPSTALSSEISVL